MKRMTTKTFVQKKGLEKLALVTAYDAIFAKIADSAGVDAILVGDSVGNTFMGFENTLPVTMDDMLHHVSMVARAKPRALVIADVPFAIAHYSFDTLLRECAKFIQAGADAIKLESAKNLGEKISGLTNAGIPVMGHIGLMPQQLLKLGAYKTFGKTAEEQAELVRGAKALEEAGAFAVVIEKTAPEAAALVTKSISIPTIGIGAGKDCDGQILVSTDILGLGDWIPPFAKKYCELAAISQKAFADYVEEVRASKFPQ